MFTIKVSHHRSTFPGIERQSPGGSAIWGDCRFIINQEVEECDAWIVTEGIDSEERTKCPDGRLVFITQEPPRVRRYNPLFLRQFDMVVSPHPLLVHGNVVHDQPGLPWFVGARFDKKKRDWSKDHSKTYDELKQMSPPTKTKGASVITSDKVITKEHKRRLEFVKELERRLGNELDVYITGKDSKMEDKWDALAGYRYHIALENSVCRDYWTEKLADPYLAYCHPIYYGCPNLTRFFPQGSYTPIDIRRMDQAIETIAKVVESDTYERSIDQVVEARRRVLDEHNFFPYAAKMVHSIKAGEARERCLTKELVIPRGKNAVNLVMKRMRR